MLVRRLLLRDGRRSCSPRLRVCRGCSVGCKEEGRPGVLACLRYLFPAFQLLSTAYPSFPFPSPANQLHDQARTSVIINEDLKHIIRQTYSGIYLPTTTRPVRSLCIYHPSMHIPFSSSPFPLPSFQTPFSSPTHAFSTLALQFLYGPPLYSNSNVIPVLLRTHVFIHHLHIQP